MSENVVGPFKVEVTFYLSDGEGRIGKAAYLMPAGRPVTLEAIAKAVPDVIRAAGENFRLLDEQEFWDQLIIDKYGRHIPTAKPADIAFDKAFKP